MTVVQQAVKYSNNLPNTGNKLDISLHVELTHEDGYKATYSTLNISTTGLRLDKGNNKPPQPGSIVHVQICSDSGMLDAPLVKAKVTDIMEHGIDISFLTS